MLSHLFITLLNKKLYNTTDGLINGSAPSYYLVGEMIPTMK